MTGSKYDIPAVRRLAADVRHYGTHRPECAAWGPSHGSIPAAPWLCDCGFSKAAKRASGYPEPPRPAEAEESPPRGGVFGDEPDIAR